MMTTNDPYEWVRAAYAIRAQEDYIAMLKAFVKDGNDRAEAMIGPAEKYLLELRAKFKEIDERMEER